LAQRYTSALSRYFERRVGDKAEAADLVQDVFVRLARLPDPSSIEKPDRYLFATAASALRDSGRRATVRHRSGHDAFDETLHGSDTLSPERILAGKQALARFQVALRELPERTRDVFVLRVFDGLKMETVARAMGISKRAAEKHYAKAMVHVAAALQDGADD
jgi:RNA polymerase sigma-70 factor (ECF subfamily)